MHYFSVFLAPTSHNSLVVFLYKTSIHKEYTCLWPRSRTSL